MNEREPQHLLTALLTNLSTHILRQRPYETNNVFSSFRYETKRIFIP